MKNGKSTKKQSRTGWARIDARRDEDIDFSDIPEMGPDFFKNAILWPGRKKQITLRIDPDVLRFFRKHGRGYQTTINAVLRKYMEARKRASGVGDQASNRRTRARVQAKV
ncbi:MAG TPA: BrnA antitoxin family protein [Candidatus Sulfotelmatobacter sp.]|nr:BrnA antitoxin family protein [Candidatus Sulfotelmatobacter sp.]